MHALLSSVPLTLEQATTDPCLCQRLLDTHEHVWVSLLWGHCSFLLGTGAHKVLFVSSRSLFPQSYVSSDGSVVGLMSSSSKRAYAIPRSAAPRDPAPVATKVHLDKAMVFPVVMYGCESWSIKKAEHQRIDAFELWCWRRLLRVPWTVRRSNQSILKEINLVFIGRTDVEAETPILWPPDAKS